MKKNIVGAIVATVTFVIIYLLLDLIFGDTHSFREYAVQAVIFCFVWCLGRFLDERGWNSWKRIGDLFKRKKTDDQIPIYETLNSYRTVAGIYCMHLKQAAF